MSRKKPVNVVQVYVGNPSLPLLFKLEDIISSIDSLLKKKYWKDFKVIEIKLLFELFFVFKCNGKTFALNAETLEFKPDIAELFKEKKTELTHEFKEKYPVEFQKPSLKKSEIVKVIQKKISAEAGKPTTVSDIQTIYCPKWQAFVTIGEENYKLEINGVNGVLYNEEKVPEREKGFLEITKETLEDLKKPSAWFEYAKGIATETKKFTAKIPKKEKAEKTKKSRFDLNWLIIILLMIITLVILLFL